MSLKTLVKAGNITNLSDARYFAGMGVEIIGFPVGKTAENILEPGKIKEIAGWLAGIKVALELRDQSLDEDWLKTLLELLPPDYIQLPENMVGQIRTLSSLPLLIETDQLPGDLSQEDCLLYTGSLQDYEKLSHYCVKHRVILSGNAIDSTSVLQVINSIKPYGIELKGGSEISPGLKDFEELSEILELLEVDE